jgi:hypothetical protein
MTKYTENQVGELIVDIIRECNDGMINEIDHMDKWYEDESSKAKYKTYLELSEKVRSIYEAWVKKQNSH